MDKQPSLLQKSVNYSHNMFYDTGPWCVQLRHVPFPLVFSDHLVLTHLDQQSIHMQHKSFLIEFLNKYRWEGFSKQLGKAKSLICVGLVWDPQCGQLR